MKRWLTQTLPPWPFIVVYLAALLAVEAFRVIFIVVEVADIWSPGMEYGRGWFGHLMIVAFGAGGYGVWRAMHFSPLANRPYRQWLVTTPWTHQKKLPLGPWPLGVQDVLAFVILAGSAVYGGWNTVWIPIAFVLIPFTYVVTRLQWSLEQRVYACVGWFLILALPLVWNHGLAFYGLLLLIWAHSTWAVRGLVRMLDERRAHVEKILPANSVSIEEDGNELVRWPYDAMLLHLPAERNRPENCVAVAALAGFGWYVMHYLLGIVPPESEDAAFFAQALDILCAVSICLLASARWVTYRLIVKPPISVLGRIQNGLIIPRYDVYLLAPAAVLAIGFVGGAIAERSGAPDSVWQPLILFTCFLVATMAGPSLSAWRLTGGHALPGAIGIGKNSGFRF